MKQVALVMGAGDAIGSALARRFAAGGLTVAVARRNGDKLAPLESSIRASGGRCHAYSCDARDEAQVVALVARVEADLGPIALAVHNIGANVRFPLHETTTRVFRKVWELPALSAFLFGREVAARMRPRGAGCIVFTGATASVRAGAGYAAFASAMHAKRALAGVMARELGPQGVHVAHVLLDAPVDSPFVRGLLGQEEADRRREEQRMLDPDAIAETYWALYSQKPSAWTFELDLRPYAESFGTV